MTIYLILGSLAVIGTLYSLYQRSLRLREVERRVAAEAQRDALRKAQEALMRQSIKNKAEIQDAINKAEKGDYTSLFTTD